MADSQPLFEGQTTHPLSDAEREAFFKKMNISGRWFTNDNEIIRSALETIINTPSGAAQARRIIAHPIDTFNIETSRFRQTFIGAATKGYYDPLWNNVYINTHELNDPAMVGNTILHEIQHAIQQPKSDTHPFVCEAEPQALSAQLNYETGHTETDVSYQKTFEQNYNKWLAYARRPTTTPNGALRFKATSGASIKQARAAYAHQMASLEIQAQVIREFVQPLNSNGAHTLDWSKEQRNAYSRQMEDDANYVIPPHLANDLIERYHPFLKAQDFHTLQLENIQCNGEQTTLSTKETEQLLQIRELTSNPQTAAKNYREIQRRLAHEKHPLIAGRKGVLGKIQRGKTLSLDEMRLLQFALIKNTPLSDETKTNITITLLKWAENKSTRDWMTDTLIQLSGYELIGTETATMRHTLHAAQHPQTNVPQRNIGIQR